MPIKSLFKKEESPQIPTDSTTPEPTQVPQPPEPETPQVPQDSDRSRRLTALGYR